MLSALLRVFRQLFPAEGWGLPQEYAAKTLDSTDHQARVAALRAAAAAAADEARLKEFRDIAVKRIDDEGNRQASITTRAQGLFVALALFGFLFTFGASFFTQTARLDRWVLAVCLGLVAYILVQMVIMVVNILRSIRGISQPTAGSSDLTGWLGLPSQADFYRAQALLALDHYRVAALNNNWRFEHLGCALRGLRNIVFALSILILFLFAVGIVSPPSISPAASGAPAVGVRLAPSLVASLTRNFRP